LAYSLEAGNLVTLLPLTFPACLPMAKIPNASAMERDDNAAAENSATNEEPQPQGKTPLT